MQSVVMSFMKLVFCLVLSFLLQKCNARDTTEIIKIGAIFFDNELDLAATFDAVIAEINELDYDIKLKAIKRYVSLEETFALQELTCDLMEQGVAAIFGPSSKTKSDIVEILSNRTGIPHLQFDWHASKSERQRLNHLLTVNVAPTELALSTAYYDILRNKHFDWKSFTIAYESETSTAHLQHILAWKQLQNSGIKLEEFKRGDDYRLLWKRINNNREKFVMLDCPPDILQEVVNVSRFFNMTGPFNHLFLTNLDTHLSGIEKFYSKEFTVATFAVRLRYNIPPRKIDETDVFETDDEEYMTIPLHLKLIYDAVVLYFNALRKLSVYYAPKVSCERGNWHIGPKLVELMKNLSPKHVRPPYRTQRLKLNEFGERDEFNLEIYNPLIDSITHIWNKDRQVVPYDKISENSTKEIKRRKFEVKEDFSQKRVKYTVATRVGEPYFMWRPEPEGVHYEGNDRFIGYAVDLIYNLAKECDFDFHFEPVQDNAYGSYNKITKEWNGIIRQIIDKNAQLGICDLTITQARKSVVDFTTPFMQLGISVLSRKAKPPEPNPFGFFNPYALEVWLYLLVMLLLTAMALVFVARISQSEWEVNERENEQELTNIWHLRNTLWLVIGSLLNQGCDILPRGRSMRLLTAFWWIFTLLISQTYIAQMASFITSAKLRGSINNLHDLVEQNKIQFGTLKGGATSLYFSESNETENRVAWNKMLSFKPDAFTKDNIEGVDRVRRSKGKYAFLMETTSLEYYVDRDCNLTQIGEPFGTKHYAIAVPLNAPYRSNLTTGILRLSEHGVLQKLKNKWFKNSTSPCDLPGDPSGASASQVGMSSFAGLFILLIAGILISVFIAICEFLWHVQRIAVKEHIAPMVALKAEFNFFIRIWLKRKPLHTYQISRDTTSMSYSSLEQRSNTSNVRKRKKAKKKKSCSNEAS